MSYFTNDEFGPLAERAYVFGCAPVTMYRRYHAAVAEEGALNRLVHCRRLPRPGQHPSARANADTVWSEAWLDLGDEPLVISIPELGDRYYVFQLWDVYGHNFNNIGNYLAYGARPEYRRAYAFALVGPAWCGAALPDGLDVVLSPGRLVNVLYRIRVQDQAADGALVRGLQDCTTIVPLSAWRRGARNSLRTHWAASRTLADSGLMRSAGGNGHTQHHLGFFRILGAALRDDPPHTPWDRAFADTVLKDLSIAPLGAFDPDGLRPAARRLLLDAQQTAHETVNAHRRRIGEQRGTWIYTDRRVGAYEGDFLLRAAAVVSDGPCPTLQVSRSGTLFVDGAGEELRGSEQYVLRFDRDALPPVPFFSLTVYGVDTEDLASPPLHSTGLRPDADGSLTVYLSWQAPANGCAVNWARTPHGRFYVIVRLYAPSERVVSLDYMLPPAERLTSL